MKRTISTQEEHQACLTAIAILMDSGMETAEMGALGGLVADYEERTCVIDAPTWQEALRFRADQMGKHPGVLLAPLVGGSGRASEALAGKRPLTLKGIRAIHRVLAIPLDLLCAEAKADSPSGGDRNG